MKTIGIKLADGSFYPVLTENVPAEKRLDLTTARNNQTKVVVDLYRSANCTMDDAEYVDSLQIENLVAHPNGEPDITFSVSLDEENKLSAKIVDTETGKQSKTSITLVSRTQEERLITDEYNISDSKEKKVKTGGLLAAAAALREKENKTEVEFTPAADMDFNLGDSEASVQDEEIEENSDSTIEFDSESVIDPVDVPVEETSTDDMSFDLDLPDFPETEVEAESEVEPAVSEVESEPEIEPAASEEPAFETMEEPTEEPVFEVSEEPAEEPVFETVEEPASEFVEETVSEPAFNPMEETNTEIESTAEAFEETDEGITVEPEMDIPEETESSSILDTDLDLPDFSDIGTEENSNTEDDPFAMPEDKLMANDPLAAFDNIEEPKDDSLDFDLPDFTEESSDDTFQSSFDDTTLAAASFADSSEDDTNLDDFSFDDSSLDDTSLNDEDFNFDDPKDEPVPATGSGISFTGLYDKETTLGKSSDYTEDDEISKKTKAPMIICIICAIICILATAIVLFVIPSKFNLLNKKPAKETVILEEVKTPEPEPEPEPIVEEEPEPEPVPAAKEDEIVIIEKAEEVIPEQPPVAEEKPKDITYKIKWGDTLWDIADTYYKNPWRYKYIARFNGIKNPDHIISGTYITIPAE